MGIGHWALGIGHWALGIGQWELNKFKIAHASSNTILFMPHAPFPISNSPFPIFYLLVKQYLSLV
ncbi:hypothetical protein [Tolypothrix sp. VBCCA 56010]|uniref:hypothetical protein n=1 Tax=Tolypothrix sp. VBCCA 56010 TaxID=3137731 RepID=UPI003D7F0F9B